MTSRKSQRKHVSSSGGSNDLAQLVLPANMREVTTEPLVDEVTRKLGISWSRMDASEARQINQAAYSKFIANHYPALKDVKVRQAVSSAWVSPWWAGMRAPRAGRPGHSSCVLTERHERRARRADPGAAASGADL